MQGHYDFGEVMDSLKTTMMIQLKYDNMFRKALAQMPEEDAQNALDELLQAENARLSGSEEDLEAEEKKRVLFRIATLRNLKNKNYTINGKVKRLAHEVTNYYREEADFSEVERLADELAPSEPVMH